MPNLYQTSQLPGGVGLPPAPGASAAPGFSQHFPTPMPPQPVGGGYQMPVNAPRPPMQVPPAQTPWAGAPGGVGLPPAPPGAFGGMAFPPPRGSVPQPVHNLQDRIARLTARAATF